MSDGQLAALAMLLDADRFEEAARLASDIADIAAVADLLLDTSARGFFLDVDVALARIIEDVLERLPADDHARQARLRAKLALDLRGDPDSLERRRALLGRAADDAAAAGDDGALTAVLLAQVNALWEPSGIHERLAAAERAIAIARRTKDVDSEMQARIDRVDTLVALGRIREAELELAMHRRIAEPLGRPDRDTFTHSRNALIAMVHGRIDDVVSYGDAAHRSALAAGMPDADVLGQACRAVAARERSGADMDAIVEGAIASWLERAARLPGQYFEAGAAALYADLGRHAEARAELARALPSLLTSFDYRWLFSAGQAADAAAAAGSDVDCERLYTVLLPHEDAFVTLGSFFFGSVRHRLGTLGLRLGRVPEAVARLRRAVDELDDMAALSWATRARVDLARALRAAGDEEAAAREERTARDTAQTLGMTRLLARLDAENDGRRDAWSLARDGDDWMLDADDEHARLRGGRGFDHLAVLLARPGRDVPALELDGGPDAAAAGAGVEVLDKEALAAYRRRLAQINTELEGADRRGDETAAMRLEDERGQLLAQLRSATGLGGRIRRTNDVSERARVNVTRNLKRAIDQISRVAPVAGAHLVRTVRTGTVCRYDPPPDGRHF